jgi:hypothetical protein
VSTLLERFLYHVRAHLLRFSRMGNNIHVCVCVCVCVYTDVYEQTSSLEVLQTINQPSLPPLLLPLKTCSLPRPPLPTNPLPSHPLTRLSGVSSIISAATLPTPPDQLPPPTISYVGGALLLSWHALLDLQQAGGMSDTQPLSLSACKRATTVSLCKHTTVSCCLT